MKPSYHRVQVVILTFASASLFSGCARMERGITGKLERHAARAGEATGSHVADSCPQTSMDLCRGTFEETKYPFNGADPWLTPWPYCNADLLQDSDSDLFGALGRNLPLRWPVEHPDRKVISPFGTRRRTRGSFGGLHCGIDIKAPRRTPVCATADGIVVFSGTRRGYGNIVVVRHGAGIETAYAHLDVRSVKPGDNVAAGDPVGLLGSTGRVTTYHVHYEVRIDGIPVDPSRYLPE